MSLENKKLVMFDFDGVLVNTLDIRYRLHKDVNENLTFERFNSFSEGNFHEEMAKAVKKEGEEELKRSNAALAWSGLAAGLSMRKARLSRTPMSSSPPAKRA